MTYTLKWHHQAFKVLEKLPKEIIQRVLNKFDLVIEEPFRFLEHYEGENLFKLRIGDYRALVEVNIQNKILLVKVFDHRSKIYNK